MMGYQDHSMTYHSQALIAILKLSVRQGLLTAAAQGIGRETLPNIGRPRPTSGGHAYTHGSAMILRMESR